MDKYSELIDSIQRDALMVPVMIGDWHGWYPCNYLGLNYLDAKMFIGGLNSVQLKMVVEDLQGRICSLENIISKSAGFEYSRVKADFDKIDQLQEDMDKIHPPEDVSRRRKENNKILARLDKLKEIDDLESNYEEAKGLILKLNRNLTYDERYESMSSEIIEIQDSYQNYDKLISIDNNLSRIKDFKYMLRLAESIIGEQRDWKKINSKKDLLRIIHSSQFYYEYEDDNFNSMAEKLIKNFPLLTDYDQSSLIKVLRATRNGTGGSDNLFRNKKEIDRIKFLIDSYPELEYNEIFNKEMEKYF